MRGVGRPREPHSSVGLLQWRAVLGPMTLRSQLVPGVVERRSQEPDQDRRVAIPRGGTDEKRCRLLLRNDALDCGVTRIDLSSGKATRRI